MMELCAAVTGVYLGWTILALYPRRVVRLTYRQLQDIAVLMGLSFVLTVVCCETVASLVLAVTAYVMYQDLPSPHTPVAERAVLITGCDKGLGHALVLQLDTKGFRVFAGCLFPEGEGCRALVSKCSNRLVILPMNVTSETQVKKAAEIVASKLNGKVLHGVVNNAGILMPGNMELMTMADIRQVMEVNYFGTINVCRGFLPMLRQTRRGTARLINVSSNVGLAPSNLCTVYGASKAAVALSNETMRYELKPMGVDVVTIIPSGFKTGITSIQDSDSISTRWWNAATQEVREYFGRDCFNFTPQREDADSFLNPDFTPITTCMLDALLSTHPRPFYYKGLLARSWPFLYLHLPSCLWDKCMPFIADHYQFPVQALKQPQQLNNDNDDDDKNK